MNRQTAQVMADRVLLETSKIRELSIKRPVPTSVKSRTQIEGFMARQIGEDVKADELRANELYLRQLGLAPRNFDLKASYTRLLGEQVAGFYDSKTGAFTTSERVAASEMDTVMAHELTHALQDQHFDLGRLDKAPRHESDSKLAVSALIEGDATLVMSRYMAANPLRFFGVLVSSLGSLGGGSTAQFNQAPRSMRESLLFPYSSGLAFVTRLQARGGWNAVSFAFSRPPKSTQQVLHFDSYLANKLPEKVAVPDVSRALGRDWKLLDHDVNGEFGLSLVAGENGNDAEAKLAASGWSGDRYAVFAGPKNAVLVVQDSLWNDEASAVKWRAAYAKRTGLRFGAKAKERQDGSLSVWNAAPDGVWLRQSGRRVVMLEGTVGSFDVTRVLKALGR